LTDTQFSFACPHCGQSGSVVWRGAGAKRELVSLSDGFHEEPGRLSGVRHVIICNACDEIEPFGPAKQ